MTEPDVGVDVTDTPSMRADWPQTDAEDHPTELLAGKLRDGHPDLAMRWGASIEPGNATVNLATARDGTVVQLRLLRSLGVERAFRDGLVEGHQRLPGRPLLDASSGSVPALADPGRRCFQGSAAATSAGLARHPGRWHGRAACQRADQRAA
jgi:hypothetical protein